MNQIYKKNKIKTKDYSPKTNKGFVLILAVIISSILLSVGLSMFSVALKELILSASGRDSQLSFYAADSAIECALYWDIRHPNYPMSIFGSIEDPLLNGLVGYWALDDGAGLSASDSSNNNNSGTLTNMDPGTDWVLGEIGGALDFDGVDDYVEIANNSSLNSMTNITITAWIKADTIQSDTYNTIVRRDPTSGISRTLYNLDLSTGKLRLTFIGSESSDVTFGTGTTDLRDGSWHHVAIVRDDSGSNNAYGYVDGSEEIEVLDIAVGNFVSDPAQPTYIGQWSVDSINRRFNGTIDDVRIYNRALTESEIGDLYLKKPPSSLFEPIAQNSSVSCNEVDITDPSTGWDSVNGWDVFGVSPTGATTVFDMAFANGSCATVTVIKDSGSTRIDSRGYNTCNLDYPRRVERGLRVRY